MRVGQCRPCGQRQASFYMCNHQSRVLSTLLLAFAAIVLVPVRAQVTKPDTVTVFENGTNRYRIPSIVRLNDGKLMAFSDLRHGTGDIGGSNSNTHQWIDVVGKSSSDNGATWSNQATILQGSPESSKDYNSAFGDAATVVDRESGKILMMTAAGSYGFFSETKIKVARAVSEDGGKTWTHSEATDKLYQNDTYVKHLFFSSGRMIQSTKVKKGDYYRIYAAVNTRVEPDWYAWDNGGSRVVYSDDFGQTWKYLGGIDKKPAPLGDECKVEELPNGDILLSCRANGYARYIVGKDTTRYGSAGRYFNVYSFNDRENGTGSWGTVVRSGRYVEDADEGQTYGSSTNGEILLIPAVGKDGERTFVLLQSIPYASGNTRINGTIYWRELKSQDKYTPDEFVTGWKKYSVNQGGMDFAYSTMVLDQKGNVAFVYEGNGKNWGYDIKFFKSLSLETITGGEYSYSAGPINGFYTTSDPAWKHGSVVVVAAPTFSVSAGTYAYDLSVELTATDAGTAIYYTTDGSTPTTKSTLYTEAISVSSTTTLKAIAVDAEGNQSAVTSAAYVIDKTVPAPTFSVSAGTYNSEQTVELMATSDVKIYYTLDGSEPTTESTLYNNVAISISTTTMVRAIAVDGYGNQSAVATATYSIVTKKDEDKLGTTISLDNDCTHQLYSNGASNANMDKQPFSYLRHDIAHVQMISASDAQLSSGGAGIFEIKSNNMLFNEVDGKKYLSLYRGQSKYKPYKKVPYCYVAVVAPKGYRFIRYQMDIFAEQSKDGAVVSQYVYDENDGVRRLDSVTVAMGMPVWDKTLSKGTNVLYFRVNCNDTLAAHSVMLKSLKLTYVIDQPFDAVVPGDGGNLEVHTGLLDLGTFSSNKTSKPNANGGAGYWSFDDSRVVTDAQKVNIVNSDGSEPEVVTVNDNSYFVAAANGDYYVEAPQKFRIVGATLNFLRSEVDGEVKTTTSKVAIASLQSGSEYVLGSHNEEGKVRHYLNLNSSGKIEDETDPAKATKWTIIKSISGVQEYYTIQSNGKYLSYSNGLEVSSSAYNWIFNATTTGEWGFRTPKIEGVNYNIKYDKAGKKWVATKGVDYLGAIPMSLTIETIKKNYNASNFTASAYDREGTGTPNENVRKLTSTNNTASVELEDFNNDAVCFNISGLTGTNAAALYNVTLRLLPLNPEVQTLQVASEVDGKVVGTNEVTSLNYVFNNGKTVNVLVPEGKTTYPIVFREAQNEEKTWWYDNGQNENRDTSGGYSNYYLIHSDADGDNGLDKDATPYAGARVSAKKVSTAKLIATNIEEVAAGKASELKDNEFDKGQTKPTELSLVDGVEETVYVYSADEPTFQIMPDGKGSKLKHIDYRYYTITVKPMVMKKTAVATITPIYKNGTLKGENHKTAGEIKSNGGTLDTSLHFVGVTITATDGEGETSSGVLSNVEVINAITTALEEYRKKNGGVDEKDSYRGVLYVDMSGLTAVTAETVNGMNPWDAFHKGTADNCLYFMPEGFLRNVENTIAKTESGFEAVGDIVVYDQQPFFTPYDFKTGLRRAKYEREGTATNGTDNKAKVKEMATVLPFNVPLDGEGNLKTSADVADNAVTFRGITGYGEVTSVLSGSGKDITYAMVAENVTEGEAKANQPYYVTTSEPGFSFSIAGATFEATPEDESLLARTSTSEDGKVSWTARGTYSGVQPAKDDHLWYFAQNYFWKSGALVSNDHVNIRPFRAYFVSSENVAGVKAGVVFSSSDIVSTGINDVLAPTNGMTVAGGKGFVAVSCATDTELCVRSVSGQVVASRALEAGQTWRVSLPQGVYLVNQLKVLVK